VLVHTFASEQNQDHNKGLPHCLSASMPLQPSRKARSRERKKRGTFAALLAQDESKSWAEVCCPVVCSEAFAELDLAFQQFFLYYSIWWIGIMAVLVVSKVYEVRLHSSNVYAHVDVANGCQALADLGFMIIGLLIFVPSFAYPLLFPSDVLLLWAPICMLNAAFPSVG
jgi:hypothetical protein